MVQSLRRLIITGLLSSAAMAEIRPRAYIQFLRTLLLQPRLNAEKKLAIFLTKAAELPEKTLSSENILYLMVVLKQF
jgi:hypothetical protein